MTEKPLITPPGEGPCLWHGDALWEFKVRSENTGNRFWLAELSANKGWASPVHVHSREDETFVVLEGALRVCLDDVDHDVPAGATVFLPRQVPHAYAVWSDQARFLALGTPGGFDGWFFETGRPADTRTVPPPAEVEPDWPAYVAKLREYGVDFVGPPPW
jgi:quercetin dioxygenase-like cupin family protein